MSKGCRCKMVVPIGRKTKISNGSNIKQSSLYNIWANITYRCRFGNRFEKNYAGRGIKMSSEWLDNYRTFERDIGPRPTPEHSVDRKDNSRGYCRHNCRWATKYEQSLNSRGVEKHGLPKGVTLTRRSKTFFVRPWVNGVGVYLGTFKKKEEAIRMLKNYCGEL